MYYWNLYFWLNFWIPHWVLGGRRPLNQLFEHFWKMTSVKPNMWSNLGTCLNTGRTESIQSLNCSAFIVDLPSLNQFGYLLWLLRYVLPKISERSWFSRFLLKINRLTKCITLKCYSLIGHVHPCTHPLVVLCIAGAIFSVDWVVLRTDALARVLLSLISIFSNMFSKVIIYAHLYF